MNSEVGIHEIFIARERPINLGNPSTTGGITVHYRNHTTASQLNITYTDSELKTLIRMLASSGAAPSAVFIAYIFQSLFNRLGLGEPFAPVAFRRLDPVSVYKLSRHTYAGVVSAMIAGMARKPAFIGASEAVSAPFRGTPHEYHAFLAGAVVASLSETLAGYTGYVRQMHQELLADSMAKQAWHTVKSTVHPLSPPILRTVGSRIFAFLLGGNTLILGGNQLGRDVVGKQLGWDINTPYASFGFMLSSNVIFSPLLVALNTAANVSAKNTLLQAPAQTQNFLHLVWQELSRLTPGKMAARIAWKGVENGLLLGAVVAAVNRYAQWRESSLDAPIATPDRVEDVKAFKGSSVAWVSSVLMAQDERPLKLASCSAQAPMLPMAGIVRPAFTDNVNAIGSYRIGGVLRVTQQASVEGSPCAPRFGI